MYLYKNVRALLVVSGNKRRRGQSSDRQRRLENRPGRRSRRGGPHRRQALDHRQARPLGESQRQLRDPPDFLNTRPPQCVCVRCR